MPLPHQIEFFQTQEVEKVISIQILRSADVRQCLKALLKDIQLCFLRCTRSEQLVEIELPRFWILILSISPFSCLCKQPPVLLPPHFAFRGQTQLWGQASFLCAS